MPVANRLYLACAYYGSDRCTCARACSRSHETPKESIWYPTSGRYRDTSHGFCCSVHDLQRQTYLTNCSSYLTTSKIIFLGKLNHNGGVCFTRTCFMYDLQSGLIFPKVSVVCRQNQIKFCWKLEMKIQNSRSKFHIGWNKRRADFPRGTLQIVLFIC